MEKKPGSAAPAAAFVRGPSLVPAPRLVAWLESQKRDGQPRLVRLPLVLRVTDMGIALAGTRVGGDPAALELYANDAALGIGLADRMRGKCSPGELCAVWAQGYWRGTVAGGYQFDVVDVSGTIAPGDLAAANYAEVEGESGN